MFHPWVILLFPLRVIAWPIVPVLCGVAYGLTSNTAPDISYVSFTWEVSRYWLLWHA